MKTQDLHDTVQQTSTALSVLETEFHKWRKARTPEAAADKNNFELEHWTKRLQKARHDYATAHRDWVTATKIRET